MRTYKQLLTESQVIHKLGSEIPGLTIDALDDWLILAQDRDGNDWFVNTEMWPEWEDETDMDKGERDVLARAKQRKNSIQWSRFLD